MDMISEALDFLCPKQGNINWKGAKLSLESWFLMYHRDYS